MTVPALEDASTLENETVTLISTSDRDLDASVVVEESMLTTSEMDRIVRPVISETSTTTNQALTCKTGRISTMTDTSKIIRKIEKERKERRQRELAAFKEISTALPEVADEIDSKFEELQEKIEDESAVGNIVCELSEYAFSPEYITIIAASGDLEALDGGIDLLFDCIQRYPSDVTVIAYGVRTLGRLAYNEENRSTIVKKGGIKVAIEAMTKFPDQENVQQYGCFAFGSMAYGNDNNKTAIARQGGIELVAKAMIKFPNQEEIQHGACFAFAILSNNDNRRIAMIAGEMELIVHAMTKFPNREELQMCCCFIIANVTWNHEEEEPRRAGELLGGIVNAVVAAMKQFPNSENVLPSACFALEALGSSSAKSKKDIIGLGGVELARHAWTHVLSDSSKRESKSFILLRFQNRFIFTDSFLQNY